MSNNFIKGRRENNKVEIPDYKLNFPVFSFKYLTKNSSFNIKYFKKSREKQKAYGALFYTIEEMSKSTWIELYQKGKRKGIETIPIKELKFKPNGITLTPDTKVISIRFKRQEYRLIGVQSDINTDVFHVFGFDFNYKAYNH